MCLLLAGSASSQNGEKMAVQQSYIFFALLVGNIWIPAATAIDRLRFRLGTDAEIPLSVTLQPNSTWCCEIFSIRQKDAFFKNGEMRPEGLDQDQIDRFNVSNSTIGDLVTVTVTIQRIQDIDEGVYVMSVRQHHVDGSDSNLMADVYVHVLLPPGPGTCTVNPSPYSDNLRFVKCQANLSTDGGGLLVCYQNGRKAPFLSNIEYTNTLVVATFWMDTDNPINCCSYEANFIKEPLECTDISFDLRIQADKSMSPSTLSMLQPEDAVSSESPLDASTSESTHAKEAWLERCMASMKLSSLSTTVFIDSAESDYEYDTLNYELGFYVSISLNALLIVIFIVFIVYTKCKLNRSKVDTNPTQTTSGMPEAGVLLSPCSQQMQENGRVVPCVPHDSQ